MLDATTTVPSSPALAPWCRVVEDEGRLLVEYGDTVVTFEGRAADRLLPALLPLLDGTRSVDEINRTLGRPVAPAVLGALSLLAENHLLVDGPHRAADSDPLTAAATFAAAVSGTPIADTTEALVVARVAVLGSSRAATEIARQLREMGVGCVEDGVLHGDSTDAPLVVAAPSPCETIELESLNARRLERGEAWLPALPFDGRRLIVGPFVLPGESACRECYLVRRAAASGYDEDFDRIDRTRLRAASPEPISVIAAGLVSLLVLRWLTVRDPRVPGSLYAFENAPAFRLEHHRVLRVPRCRVCGPYPRALPSLWFDEGR